MTFEVMFELQCVANLGSLVQVCCANWVRVQGVTVVRVTLGDDWPTLRVVELFDEVTCMSLVVFRGAGGQLHNRRSQSTQKVQVLLRANFTVSNLRITAPGGVIRDLQLADPYFRALPKSWWELYALAILENHALKLFVPHYVGYADWSLWFIDGRPSENIARIYIIFCLAGLILFIAFRRCHELYIIHFR